MASVRGSGRSFFSRAAPTIQLLSTEPIEQDGVGGRKTSQKTGTKKKKRPRGDTSELLLIYSPPPRTLELSGDLAAVALVFWVFFFPI